MSRIFDRRKFLKACTGVAGASVLARYRAMAESLGFEGHIAWAQAMADG